ncbi:MAG TPA: hypothetical protein VK720_10335 [Terracidiphilus sp.]|nr:hypothetical protein [Terracidiphilus sp.]
MAQMDETQRSAPAGIDAIEAERRRLQALVGELLAANQELRFKLARLERNLSETTTIYGMLAP